MTNRRLILMRHASASARGESDLLRPLTPTGRAEALRMGRRLRDQGLIPDRVISSRARRCRETWDALRQGLEAEVDVDFQNRLYEASERTLLEAIAEVDDAGTLLVLAHNPGVSDLAHGLCRPDGTGTLLRAGFQPAALACFELDGDASAVSRRTVRLIAFEEPASPG